MRKIFEHSKKLAELENLTKQLEQSPAIVAFQREQAEQRLKQRQTTAEKIKSLEVERDDLVAMREKISDLDADLKKKDAERMNLLNKLVKAKSTYAGKNSSIEARLGNLRGELLESCHPAIDEAIRFFNDRLHWLRSPGRISTQNVSRLAKNLFSEKIRSSISSNLDAVKLAMSYCQNAIKTLEAMKLEAKADLKEIEKLKSNIPSIETFSQVEVERTMPGTKTPSFEAIIPSDSELNYRRDKLLAA